MKRYLLYKEVLVMTLDIKKYIDDDSITSHVSI